MSYQGSPNKFLSKVFMCTLCIFLVACTDDKNKVTQIDKNWNEELLTGLFKKPVSTYEPLLYPEVTNLEQLQVATARMYMPYKAVFDAYKEITSVQMEDPKEHVARIDYTLKGQVTYEAYTYVAKSLVEPEADTAYLIIPGSGVNEAGKIFYADDTDYHCCLRNKIDKNADVYVYVKPNNDFLAVHHQGKVLNGKVALFPQLLMMGGSYSTRYLVDAIALAKHLKGKYKKLVIAGLSQGGNAALIISLQVEPDVAIVASGYSVLNSGPVYVAGINQIVIPGFLDVYTPEYIANVMGQQITQYMFTFGEAEAGIYGYESVEKATEKAFEKIKNIQFYYHPDAHVFPVEAIISFLKKQGL